MKTITVFTPSYNRAHLLGRLYASLQRQTCKDFIWLIIDDGSTDDTGSLVKKWQQTETEFSIEYCYKENGGLYTGYNKAIELIETELCMCVDSDDYLADDAIEKILVFWKKEGSDQYAGVIGLDCTTAGEIIGGMFPPEVKEINLVDTMLGLGSIKDVDWKNVVRTALYKEVAPMKEFPDERDFNPHYMHIEICKKYNFLALNEVLCYVEYQPDGMTATVFKQYLRSPKSFREMRLLSMSFPQAPLLYKLKTNIHYVSSCILSQKPCISESPQKFLTLLMFPFGCIWTLYLLAINRFGR